MGDFCDCNGLEDEMIKGILPGGMFGSKAGRLGQKDFEDMFPFHVEAKRSWFDAGALELSFPSHHG